MATAVLPGSLRTKLTALARRMALLRVTRAAAMTVLILALTAAVALAADYWLKLPAAARFAMLGGWAILAVVGVVRCLRSIGHQADVDALAALIESEYPNLAERLTTSVELSEAGDRAHGSPALVELLLRETEIRTSSLNFLQAAPEKATYRRAGVATVVLIALLAPAAIWPQSYLAEAKRLVMPWAPNIVNYHVVTPRGDFAVARGQSVTLAAYVEATGPVDELPANATLVITDAAGKTTRLGMKSDQAQVFHQKINTVSDSFRYRIESGEAVSADFEVKAIDPVQLVADSPAITIIPPAYAQKSVETRTITGLGDFSALQYGKLVYEFRFNKPASAARVDWAPFQGETLGKAIRSELALSSDGKSARFEMPVEKSGRFTVALEAEYGILTELPPQNLTVIIDRAPAFVKSTGVTEQLRTVSAFETVPIELTIADDYGVETVQIEYRVNDGKVKTETIALDGIGTTQAAGAYGLKLTGKVKEEDSFQFRFKAADNRHVPEAKLDPQVVYLPGENKWFQFKIAKNAEPLKQQEILAQRDEVRDRLQRLIEALRSEQRLLYNAKTEARKMQKMSTDAGMLLRDLRADHQTNDKALTELARDTANTPALKPLANRMQDVSDQEMHSASAALQQAEREKTSSTPRDTQFRKADDELGAAIEKLEGLKAQNNQLAQQRMDQMKLEQLAERQQQLAEQAKNEQDPKKAQDLAKEQQRLADELKKLTEQSDPLKQALEAAQAEKNKELADKARELAQQQRDLRDAEKQTNKEALKGPLDDLAKKQQELADKAAKLAKETEKPTTAAQTKPLDAEKPREAAESLEKGDPNSALTKQEQTAQDLDRLAKDLDKAIQLGRDPREAAKQLARLQDELKNRTSNEAKKTPLDKMNRERLQELRAEEKAIKQAIDGLTVPDANAEAKRERAEAELHAQRAADELANKDQNKAQGHMELAKQALNRLADKLPTLQQRLATARDEVGKLRREQDDIAQKAEQLSKQPNSPDAEQARRDLAQKLSESAKKQAQTAEKLGKLDLPTLEQRQERTQESMNKALQDLLAGRKQDIPASQGDAKRQLERLEQALNSQKPVDEKAAELAQRQQKLADQAAQLSRKEGDKSREMQKLQAEQQQLAQETTGLPKTEASQRQAEANEATKQSDKAARQNPDQLAEKSKDAAQALQRLADQLNGGESDAKKADRLAKKQAELAKNAEDLAKKPDQPAKDELRKKQQQLQEEAKQLRGGENAAKEKQNADDALARLSRQQPEKAPEASKQAADALKQLAEKLDRQQDQARAEKQPPTAKQLAEQQRQLAQETQQARQQSAKQSPQQAQENMQRLAREQSKLGEQAGQLPNSQPQALEQARQAMNRAEQSLTKGDWDKAKQNQQDATRALEQLARQQPQQANNNRPQPANQPQKGEQQPSNNLPNRQQADQARQLAQDQRELRDAVQKAMSDQAAKNQQQQGNPTGELAKEQKEIADAAQKLAQQQAQQNGQQSPQAQQSQQAAKAAQQASSQMQSGALPQAKQSGQQAAQQMRQMQQNNQGDPGKQAGELAKRQEDVNRKLEQLAGNAQAQQAQQQSRQQELTKQAQQLGQQMQQQASQMRGSPQQQAMQQAAQSTQKAEGAMQQAQRGQQQGNQPATQQSQQQAAQNLDRAAQLAQQAAGQQQGQQQANGKPQQQTGQQLQQAQNQMGDAKQQLGQGQPQQAQGSMQNAAQSLQQAAQSLAQQQQGGPPNGPTPKGENDGSKTGAMIDLARYGKDAAKFQGKAWGELPGELRTRIIQDMKAQYGDDYGRMIKLYFEQLSDRKTPAPR